MHRRHFLQQTALASASLLFQQKAMASILSTGDFQVKMLRNNVGIFTERGGTIGFLLSKNGTVVIDAQFPDTSKHLIDELEKQKAAHFLYLLNTHHHSDHTAGNIAYKGLVGHVVAQENSLANQKRVAEANNTIDKQLLPDMTFSKEWKLKLDDEKIKAEYYGPGHTNGDAVYQIENANIIHAGDLMFNKRHPFVDRSAGANIASWIKDLDGILNMAGKDTIIIFGHSLNPGEETGTIEDVKKFQDYLGKVLSFADAEIKKGVSKEEFIKNTSIPGVTEWSGQGIDRPLTAAYEELTERK
jgi:cyclase